MQSVISYPARGAGGSAAWRGNFAPQLVEDLLDQYHPRKVRDPMGGSMTTRDVCTRKGVNAWVTDLHQGFDALTAEWPLGGDLTILHPPYWDIVPYSGSVWGKSPDPRDPSTWGNSPEDYGRFIKWLNEVTYRAYESAAAGGLLAILVADVRKKGRLYPISYDMTRWGSPEAVCIKIQHGASTLGKSYTGHAFIPIVHETLLITKKANAYYFAINGASTRKVEIDLRRFERASWPSLVLCALQECGGQAELRSLYSTMSGYARALLAEEQGVDWQAQARRILQEYSCFTQVERGTWRIVKEGPDGANFNTTIWTKTSATLAT